MIELTRAIRGPLFPSRVVDLDGDGIAELIVVDARWETYRELDHVNAPRLARVFRWNGAEYEHASALYPQFSLDQITDIRRRLEATSLPFDYMSAAISLLLHYRDVGRADEGWAVFEGYLANAPPAVVRSPLWSGDKPPTA